MIDNGLLPFYKFAKNRQGFLLLDKAPIYHVPNSDVTPTTQKYVTFSEIFYGKTCPKSMIDAEVMLSQLFAKNGFKTAIYTPAIGKQNLPMVLSDKIMHPSAVKALTYYHHMVEQNPGDENVGALRFKESRKATNYTKYFTKNGVRQFIKMQLFDTACYNVDRHLDNFFFVTNKENLIDDVILYDYALSSLCIDKDCKEEYFEYQNFLGSLVDKTRGEMLFQFKNNETVDKFLPCKEMSEELGNVDVQGIAKDIKETIGFTVGQKYVDRIDKSIYDMANSLQKEQ